MKIEISFLILCLGRQQCIQIQLLYVVSGEVAVYVVVETRRVNSTLDLFNELYLNTLNRHALMKFVKIERRPHRFIRNLRNKRINES